MVWEAVIVDMFVAITVGVSVKWGASVSVRINQFAVGRCHRGRGRVAIFVVVKIVNVVAGAVGIVDATSGVRGGREGGMTCGRVVCGRAHM